MVLPTVRIMRELTKIFGIPQYSIRHTVSGPQEQLEFFCGRFRIIIDRHLTDHRFTVLERHGETYKRVNQYDSIDGLLTALRFLK
jgi:hypothetical protein